MTGSRGAGSRGTHNRANTGHARGGDAQRYGQERYGQERYDQEGYGQDRGAAWQDGPEPAPSPLVAAAQILLGLTLSCLIAALAGAVLIGAIALVVYLTK